jgi:hypothetical protein
MKTLNAKVVMMVLGVMLVVSAPTVWAQLPGPAHEPPSASTSPHVADRGMPMMDMCREMTGAMPGMMRGEMMKAMGEVMMKHGKTMMKGDGGMK